MKKTNYIIIFIVITFLASFLLSGCGPEEEVVINYVTEKSGSDDDDKDQGEQVYEDDDPDDITSESDSDQGEEEVDESTELSFISNFIGGNPGELILEIDLITGEVTGTLKMESSEIYLEGTSTKVCLFHVTGNVDGEIDTGTYDITAVMDGEASSEERSCVGGAVQYEAEAKLYRNKRFVTGIFKTSTLDYEFVMERRPDTP